MTFKGTSHFPSSPAHKCVYFMLHSSGPHLGSTNPHPTWLRRTTACNHAVMRVLLAVESANQSLPC